MCAGIPERKIALLNEAVTRDPRLRLHIVSWLKRTEESLSIKRERRLRNLRSTIGAWPKLRCRRHAAATGFGELHLAQAFHFLYVTKDLDQARIETELARRTLPNNAELEFIAGRVARRQGRWDEAIRCLETGSDLGPARQALSVHAWLRLIAFCDVTRTYDRMMDQVIAMSTSAKPGDAHVERALGDLRAEPTWGLRTAVAARICREQFGRRRSRRIWRSFVVVEPRSRRPIA